MPQKIQLMNIYFYYIIQHIEHINIKFSFFCITSSLVLASTTITTTNNNNNNPNAQHLISLIQHNVSSPSLSASHPLPSTSSSSLSLPYPPPPPPTQPSHISLNELDLGVSLLLRMEPYTFLATGGVSDNSIRLKLSRWCFKNTRL